MDARGASWIRRVAVAGAALTTLHLIWLRPRLMTLGATDVEAHRHLPGDDKVPEAHPHVEWVRKEGLWPRFGHSTWAFVLEPLDGGRRTRLHYYVPFGFHVVYWPLFELVDYVLQPVMLQNIKRRAEAATSPRAPIASRPAT